MAHLTDEHIAEFQMLYKKHFGIEITKEQALEKGLRLIRLVQVVSRAVAEETANSERGDTEKPQ